MPTIDINELERYINNIAKEAMNSGNGVKNVVIEEGKQHVQTDVYNVYTPNPDNPKSYKRTGELKENWKTEPTADGMAVYNDRRDGSRYVAEIVDTGIGYQFDFEYNGKPRPFIENTRISLEGSDKLTNGLKQDLRAMGIDVD